MYLDRDGIVARGLLHYVGLVADAVGVGPESSITQLDDPVSVYVALDRRAERYPEHDLALLWDERHGWSLALEVPGGALLTPLGYLPAADRLPEPRVVAEFVENACADGQLGAERPVPPDPGDDLVGRLAAFAGAPVRESGIARPEVAGGQPAPYG
jgi:hypothetical protein